LGNPQVVVAVIDDGFDLTHPDLSENGKIVSPKDFTRNSNNPSPDPLNKDWHGTACAGVAVGSANNSGIVGAAPNCRLMPVRWGSFLTVDAAGAVNKLLDN
jgi:subtilisin family serine protease